VSPSSITILANGQITPSPHNTITVELIEPDDMPLAVRIVWPSQPTIVQPVHFPEVASVIVRLFARASTELARIRANRL
jgi:hypothetical protein